MAVKGVGRAVASGRSTIPRWVLAALGALISGVLVFWAIPVLLTRAPAVDGADRHAAMGEVRTALLTMLGASGAVVGIAYTARSYRLSQVAHLTGRFQDAARLMAETDPLAKLGGIEAMAQLADEWPDERQRCIDMLCAHIRHAVPAGTKAGDRDGEEVAKEKKVDSVDHEADTRRRVIELIRDSVVDGSSKSWQGCHFDFRGTVLGGLDLRNLSISGVSFDFSGATFVAGKDPKVIDLSGSTLRDVTLRFDKASITSDAGVDLSGATLVGSSVHLDEVTITEGVLSFTSATIDSTSSVSFAGSTTTGGTLDFTEATIGGALTFAGATLLAGKSKEIVSFDRASIADVISFDGGTIDRQVSFRGADLRGGGVSACLETPPALRLAFDGARCDRATFTCVDPSRPMEFDLKGAIGEHKLVPPPVDATTSGAEATVGR